MNEERALRLFARCANAGDFSPIASLLHKKASFEAYNRFYRSQGRDSVAWVLAEMAEALRARAEPDRAYHGFMMVQHDIIGMRAESCAVLMRSDPRKAEGIVRIRCTPLHIKDIRVLDPAKCTCTRGPYAGTEGR
jgi:hypothetical protein